MDSLGCQKNGEADDLHPFLVPKDEVMHDHQRVALQCKRRCFLDIDCFITLVVVLYLIGLAYRFYDIQSLYSNVIDTLQIL